jgi:hypothetical protein
MPILPLVIGFFFACDSLLYKENDEKKIEDKLCFALGVGLQQLAWHKETLRELFCGSTN